VGNITPLKQNFPLAKPSFQANAVNPTSKIKKLSFKSDLNNLLSFLIFSANPPILYHM